MTTLVTTISGAYQVTEVDVTAATYTVANIVYPLYGQLLVVIIKNTSGGATTVSWGAGYKLGAWTSPATGLILLLGLADPLRSMLTLQAKPMSRSVAAQ